MAFVILQGDALHIPLADESVQCVPTSPPYYGLRCYNVPPTDWPEVEYAPMPGLPPLRIPSMTCCLGLEETPEAYTAHLVAVFREVWRVLRKDGVAWCNLGDSYAGSMKGVGKNGAAYAGAKQATNSGSVGLPVPGWDAIGLKPKDLCGIPWRVAFALQADGWWLRSAIIWAKGISFCDTYSGSTMPESVVDRPTKAHEDIFLLAKSERYFYDHDAVKEDAVYPDDDRKARSNGGQKRMPTDMMAGVRPGSATYAKRNLRDVWAISPTPYRGAHFATFSPDIVEPMIKAGTSERGCCPSCGAPYERVLEQERLRDAAPSGNREIGRWAEEQASVGHLGGRTRRHIIGWKPTCTCNAGDPLPCIVLDPFSGAGTTVLVADRLGRNGVGLELKGEYARMGRDRVFGDAPLLALMEL